ncbi:MAG: phage/plasmid primase, P4 family [Aerococcus suis]|nr:phage/plasmid primase, P4 family [Aerococcus suis]
MKTYALLVDSEKYSEKPKAPQTAAISSRIVNHEVQVTPQELAQMVGEDGQTMVLATMRGKRKKANMKQQEVIALDFDNTETRLDKNGEVIKGQNGKAKQFKTEGSKYSDVGTILKDSFIQKNAAFIYSTFSFKDDWHKFRVVFFLDRPLTNNTQVEMLYKWLMKRYPNADPAAKDSSRLFFGGTEAVEINYDNVFDTSQVKFEKKPEKAKIGNKKVAPLKNEEAIAMFDNYLNREKEALQDYDKALSAIWVIGKAALLGEISRPLAYDCVKKLALGNPEWEVENEEKLEEALNTPLHEFNTDYSFARKFGNKVTDYTLDPQNMIASSKYLVDTLEVKSFNQKLYFKEGNHWLTDDNKLLRAVDDYIELLHSKDTELIHQFNKRSELIESENFPIQLRNNFCIKDAKIVEGGLDNFTPYYFDINYDPTAYDKEVDDFLDFLTCNRNDLRLVIEEMLGHILMTQGFPHKVFFFVGEKGSNGKSTFLEMLNSWVADLGTNISLENFEDATSVVELEGHLVNIGDDIDASYLERSSNFKILASGNTLMVRPIYASPYRMKNKATLIFTANDMPVFKDKTGGIARRVTIIPCDNVVKEADFGIDEKLSTENAKSYLLNLALQGARRMKQNGGKLSYSKTIDSQTQGYLINTDTIMMFVEEEGINEDIPTTAVYQEYKEFSEDIGQKPYSKTKFTQRLKDFGYDQHRVMRLGKRQKHYKKIN